MKYEEAIAQLDAPIGKQDYGNKIAKRGSYGTWLCMSKNGLVKCTHDWPIPYYPSEEDIGATDWVIEESKN